MKARMAAAALSIAALVTGIVGLTAGPASAASNHPGMSVAMSVGPKFVGSYIVTVQGVIPMSQWDAQGFLNNLGPNGGMQYEIWGDDPSYDDRRLTTSVQKASQPGQFWGQHLYAGPEGIYFYRSFQVSPSALNEDPEGRDELYARARFIDGDGRVRYADSGIVTGSF